MQFLADEDFPGIDVRWLREAGHGALGTDEHARSVRCRGARG